ncbi:MAG: type II toxin-antitoxin system VapC family toxin [Desulfobulbaceae bacterium]|nr:type II toxin-antitoxin system VapC family toxin [Desulfobulbaceae bacterium]
MRYMLDTNICIYLIKQKPLSVLNKLRAIAISDVVISAITLAELEYGVAKSSRPSQNNDALQEFVAPLEIMPFDDAAACRYGEIRDYLEKEGKVIGSMDMLIAAHAGSLNYTLVSNNLREFERVPGLLLANWV